MWVVKAMEIPDPVIGDDSPRQSQQNQWKCSVCLHSSAMSQGLSLLMVSGLPWLNYLQQQP